VKSAAIAVVTVESAIAPATNVLVNKDFIFFPH
jgi:hypothetical protein